MFSLAPLEQYLLVLQAAQRLNDAWAPLPLPQWELWDWLSCNITPCPTDVILVRFSCNPLLPWPDSVRHSRAYSVASHLKQWSQNPSTPFCWQILHCGGDLIGYCAEGRFGACGGEATLSLTTAIFAFSFLTSLNSNWSKLVTFPRPLTRSAAHSESCTEFTLGVSRDPSLCSLSASLLIQIFSASNSSSSLKESRKNPFHALKLGHSLQPWIRFLWRKQHLFQIQ